MHRSGFTLLELLVVLAIIVALFAILAPAVMSYRNKTNVQTTKAQIKVFERALEGYATERGGYPTTEQGLNSLIYIPLNELTQTGMIPGQGMMPGAMQPGMPGADPNNAFGGAAGVVGGQDMLNGAQPGGVGANPMDPTGGMGMQGMGAQPGMAAQPGGMGANPMDPNAMGSMGMGTNPMDPNAMGGMGTMGGMGSGWTQPTFNPALYQNVRKRPEPFLDGDMVPNDPWGNPYRYDNTLLANGLNRYTGSKKPAIWSAGYDKIDGTEDDIRNWDPTVANQQLMLQQQQGMGTNPMDPTGMGMQQGMGTNPMDPTGMGMQQGMGTNPMDPNAMGGMGTQPGGMMQPGGTAQSGGMMPPGGMAQPGGMMPPGGMAQPGGMMPPGGMTQPGGTTPMPPQPPM